MLEVSKGSWVPANKKNTMKKKEKKQETEKKNNKLGQPQSKHFRIRSLNCLLYNIKVLLCVH
jgi:hypothetical protein